jgi:hypothetical protein
LKLPGGKKLVSATATLHFKNLATEQDWFSKGIKQPHMFLLHLRNLNRRIAVRTIDDQSRPRFLNHESFPAFRAFENDVRHDMQTIPIWDCDSSRFSLLASAGARWQNRYSPKGMTAYGCCSKRPARNVD